jgi:acid phosphatase (class A)
MNKALYPLLALLLVLIPVHAADMGPETTPPRYFDPATVDYKALLPNPPAVGSPEAAKEIDLILQYQATRTPEQVARIRDEAKHLNVWLFATVLGPTFNEKNRPVTAKFFKEIDNNEWLVAKAAKDYWKRPRPPQQDARVHPPIDLPKNASYPSGHSTYGTVDALVLSELAPELKDALVARGRQIGDDRVIAGVHFPSDVEAGRTLGKAIFQALEASPVFQSDLAAAKAELSLHPDINAAKPTNN